MQDMTKTDKRRATGLLTVLLMGLFITNVDVAVVNVATPSIHDRLNASGSELQFVVSGYVLSYAMLLITGARLGDIYGYRRLFLVGLCLFTAASLGCGLAPGAAALIAARVVQGIGAALMVPQVLIGIQLNFFGDARARALGHYSVALSIGAVAGQVAGGVLVSANLFDLAWRPIFLINLPIGVALFVAALRFLPADPGGRPRRLDLWGVATLCATVLLALPPLILGRAQGWSLWIWLCLGVSLIPLAAFIVIERRIAARGDTPLINLHLVSQPAIAWALVAFAAASMTYFALLFTLALYLQQGLGKSALYSGCALVSWVAAFGIGGPVVRHLPARIMPLVAPFGYLILAAAYLAISACLFSGYGGAILLFILLGFGGLGLGIGYTANIRHLTSAVEARYAPDMSGLITTNSQISGLIGVATFGTAYFELAARPGPDAATHAIAAVVVGCAFAAFLATIAVYRSSHGVVAAAAESVA
ncbi:MFS transporter [Methylocapsa sp. S129]|uniref:MFS transporter n=1 Tax=Methylocapsa sp. S129 TaxID=1641869 RepID=UPI00131BB67E|nr:MFS transporter [Methylocapsa sp. S129]